MDLVNNLREEEGDNKDSKEEERSSMKTLIENNLKEMVIFSEIFKKLY